MKFVDEYRDAEVAQGYARAIARQVTRPWTIMEICGGQTHAIVKFGVDDLLPKTLTLVHGPGCPVCVTPIELIDKAIEIASRPGGHLLLLRRHAARARHDTRPAHRQGPGGDVRIVYSPLDAVAHRQGASGQAGRVLRRRVSRPPRRPTPWPCLRRGARGSPTSPCSSRTSSCRRPWRRSCPRPQNRVQGFLAAGHVCTVMGYAEYEPIAAKYRVPIVVTGFEPLDILQGIAMCVAQLEAGRAEVENQYARSVRREGNQPAQQLIREVFQVVRAQVARRGRDPAERPGSAARRMRTSTPSAGSAWPPRARTSTSECLSGLVLQGVLKPHECPAFGTRCTPERPLGAPMVSSEGRLRRLLPLPADATTPTPPPWSHDRDGTRGLLRQLPDPHGDYARILLAHGGGGRLMHQLIEQIFVPAFRNPLLDVRHDSAVFDDGRGRLAFTTDSYVVRPLFFPGGDIGTLAVNGTVNDLAMCGARPLYLSAGFILEEGLPVETLRRIVASMRRAADAAGVQIVTGDTKVVDRGKGDGIFITTAGVGRDRALA